MKKNNQIYLLILFLSFFLISCQNQSENKEIKSLFGTNISQKIIDNFIENEMKSLQMPALSIAIINDGKVVYHRVKGYADKENKVLANNQSIFEGASISKSVFGFFVMTFVQDGLLNLDKPLYQYLPNPDIEYDERYKKITARMVLSHRSGLPNWRDDYPEKKLFIKFEPGTKYHYSGEGYQYLAEVLKHIINTNWIGLEKEFQKRVAIPFKMEHTKFIQDNYSRTHKVQAYDKKGNWVDKNADKWWQSRDSVFVAPTTIHSEAIDFSKWMIGMMNEKGLSKKYFDELYTSHSEISNGFLKKEYTLGFSKLSILNLSEFYQHSGNSNGFTSFFIFDKDKKWGFVFFTNSKAGDQFALNITYNLLLIGTKRKQITIALTLLFAIALLLLNLALLFSKKSIMTNIRKHNLRIGILVLGGTIISLGLMLTINSKSIIYLNLIGFLVIILLIYKSLRWLLKIWKQNKIKKFELILQTLLLFGIVISGIVIGIL